MISKNEGISTCRPIEKATYQIASGIKVGGLVIKPAQRLESRMVPTSKVSGTIDLRYVPFMPKITNINTSYKERFSF